MDRIEFSKSINIDPVTQVKNCFDEVMALYSLIEGIDYEYIHGLIDEVMQKAFFVNTIYKGAVEPESRLRDTISESYEYSVSSKEEYIETVKISKNDNDFVQAA